MNALEGAKTIEVNREPDVDAADMAELLVRIDRRQEGGGGSFRVSDHAVSRYRERVDPRADYDTAHAALSSPSVQAAARFGAPYVRLPTGQRIVIEDCVVVTVLPSDNYKRQIRRNGLGRYGKCQRGRNDGENVT